MSSKTMTPISGQATDTFAADLYRHEVHASMTFPARFAMPGRFVSEPGHAGLPG